MNNKVTAVVCALIIAAGTALKPELAHAQWWNPFAPKTFEDCMLENLKGAPEGATNMIYAMCLEKFPPKEECITHNYKNNEEVPIKVLYGVRTFGIHHELSLTLFNKDANWALKSMDVKVETKSPPHSKTYSVALTAPLEPQREANAKIFVDQAINESYTYVEGDMKTLSEAARNIKVRVSSIKMCRHITR